MKTVETITTAKDILTLVDWVCSQKLNTKYKLCDEKDVRLVHSFPELAPKWFVPVTFYLPGDFKEIKYFIFDHEFCSLTVQSENPKLVIRNSMKLVEVDAWISYFYHWLIEIDDDKFVVRTVFNIPKTYDPVVLKDYLKDRFYYEHQSKCPVLFLAADDVMAAFPFRNFIKQVKNIELKVTSYNEPIWVLSLGKGVKYVVYPFVLHRFCDDLNGNHDFEELREPKVGEEFLFYHSLGNIISPLISLKVENEQELSILRFSEMSIKPEEKFDLTF